jgi:hypothetical protein
MLTLIAISNFEAAEFGALVIGRPNCRSVGMTAPLRQSRHWEGSAIG